MAVKLFLHIVNHCDAQTPVGWLLYDTATQEVVGEGAHDLAAIAELVSQADKRHRPVVLLGAEQILVSQVQVPTKQKAQITQAVPFLTEENLALDVEQNHFAIDYQVHDSKVTVATIELVKLQQLLATLSEFGFEPSYLSSDVFFCAYEKNCWHLTLTPERALLRYSSNQGAAIELDNIALLVNACVDAQSEQELSQLEKIQVFGNEDDKPELLLTQLENEISHLNGVEINACESGHSFLEDAARCYLAKGHYDLDLLQGEFRVSAEGKSESMPWHWLAYAASVWFVLQLLLSVGEGWYLQQQADQVLGQAREHYRQHFSQSKKDLSMSRMVRVVKSQNLAAGDEGGNGFMGVFSRLAPVTQQVVAKGVSLQTLSFSNARKELVLDVLAPSYEQLDALQQGLSQVRLQADITSVNSDGNDSVRGRVKVKSS